MQSIKGLKSNHLDDDITVRAITFWLPTRNDKNKKCRKPLKYKNLRHLLIAGDERIELPPKVLETPIIPFDQSPIFGCVFITVEIIHIKHTIVKR